MALLTISDAPNQAPLPHLLLQASILQSVNMTQLIPHHTLNPDDGDSIFLLNNCICLQKHGVTAQKTTM